MKHFLSLLLGSLLFTLNASSYDWTAKNLSNYSIAFEVSEGDIKAPFIKLEPHSMGQSVMTSTCNPRIEVSYIDKEGTLTPVWNEGMLKSPYKICTFANKVISFRPINSENPTGSWYAS